MTLAHLSPIFDLHLNRARNPAVVQWSAYDFIALIQLTVDTIAVSSGLDGNLGAPRSAVLTEMTRTAAAMAPHRPADEHAHTSPATCWTTSFATTRRTRTLPWNYADPAASRQPATHSSSRHAAHALT